MDIDKLQKALAIMNKDGKSGTAYGYHDEIQLYPMADAFTKEEVAELEGLGFFDTEDEEGFMCFT